MSNEKKVESKVVVKREEYTSRKDGKNYYGYFVRGLIKGREVKPYLIAPDNGGYIVLDIAFSDAVSTELVAVPYSMTDEKTGDVIKGNTFIVRCINADGEVMEADVKPKAKSDKRLLEMLLQLTD